MNMDIAHVDKAQSWFEVLQTTQRSQTAVMILEAGDHSSEEMNTHEKSDQVLLLLEGELKAEVGGETHVMRKGDTCIVSAGTPHRFENKGKARAITFNVYSPPEYTPGEKG
jgi:mannose-6-phosphate isomerase-like protein (cupin superfamily)